MLELLPDREDRIYLSPYDLIPLSDAGIRGGIIAMRPLNQENLEGLLVSDPTTWPPIKVTKTNIGYVAVDGNHRRKAAELRNLDRLLATCEPFTNENDVIEAAFRANLHHGLKASSENKSDYAYWLHVTFPQMEQEEIAERVGVTQSTVSKAIARRDEEVRRARQGEVVDEKTRRSLIKKSCRSFTRGALRFLTEVDGLDDEELMQTLQEVVKKAEDKAKLAHIGRLLNTGDPSATQTTVPLRLRQFAGPSHATDRHG